MKFVMWSAQVNNAHSSMHTAAILPKEEEEQFGPDSQEWQIWLRVHAVQAV